MILLLSYVWIVPGRCQYYKGNTWLCYIMCYLWNTDISQGQSRRKTITKSCVTFVILTSILLLSYVGIVPGRCQYYKGNTWFCYCLTSGLSLGDVSITKVTHDFVIVLRHLCNTDISQRQSRRKTITKSGVTFVILTSPRDIPDVRQ
jgi:hypothetical protein